MSTASESSSEVELVDEVKNVELFWFLENGKVKSSKDVPASFKNDDGSGPKVQGLKSFMAFCALK